MRELAWTELPLKSSDAQMDYDRSRSSAHADSADADFMLAASSGQSGRLQSRNFGLNSSGMGWPKPPTTIPRSFTILVKGLPILAKIKIIIFQYFKICICRRSGAEAPPQKLVN